MLKTDGVKKNQQLNLIVMLKEKPVTRFHHFSFNNRSGRVGNLPVAIVQSDRSSPENKPREQ